MRKGLRFGEDVKMGTVERCNRTVRYDWLR